jgi:nucleoside-diphosphate-sugar epimerase
MHYLITGADGFIGKHLHAHFTQAGHRVSKFTKTTAWSLEDHICERPDVVIHLAAFVKNTNERTHLDDTILTQRVYSYIQRYSPKTKLIYASTVNVYKSPSAVGCNETFEKEPRTLYEYSKLVGEHIVRQHSNYCILRLSNVYGQGMRHGVLYDWLQKDSVTIGEREPYSTRSFVNIKTVVKAFDRVSDATIINDVFNVCGNRYTNLKEVAEYMKLPFFTTNSKDSTILLPSGEKLKTKFGIVDNSDIALEIHRLKFPGDRP